MSLRDRYELAPQMRRAVVSVVSTIAQGCGRTGDAEFASSLKIARGSASELKAQLIIAGDLKALDQETIVRLLHGATRVVRLLSGLLRRLREGRQRSVISDKPSAISYQL